MYKPFFCFYGKIFNLRVDKSNNKSYNKANLLKGVIAIKATKILLAMVIALSYTCYYQSTNPKIVEKEVVKTEYVQATKATSFVAECTAYTEGFESCGKLPTHPAYGITASGKRVAVGMIAADTTVLPFGTKVYIDGMGIYTVEDTGGAIKGNKVDIYMPNLDDAIKFGRQHRNLIVLN